MERTTGTENRTYTCVRILYHYLIVAQLLFLFLLTIFFFGFLTFGGRVFPSIVFVFHCSLSTTYSSANFEITSLLPYSFFLPHPPSHCFPDPTALLLFLTSLSSYFSFILLSVSHPYPSLTHPSLILLSLSPIHPSHPSPSSSLLQDAISAATKKKEEIHPPIHASILSKINLNNNQKAGLIFLPRHGHKVRSKDKKIRLRWMCCYFLVTYC